MSTKLLEKEKTKKVRKTPILNYQRLHFTIEGGWFTWMLRHLWVEGNEMKAIRMWNASFPEYSSVQYLKGFFLDVVSGERKFTGENSFQLVKDGSKYWSTTAGDKPNKSFPLLQSWEDVILLKRVKLYLAEIDLRSFRMNRRYGETHEDVENNSLKWLDASTENTIENNLRNKVNEYYTSMRNLSMLVGQDLSLELIPDEAEKLDTKAYYSKGIGWQEKGDTGINNGLKLFFQIMKTITPWKIYFKNKYGFDMLFVNEEYLREICGCSTQKVDYYSRGKNVISEDEIVSTLKASIPSNEEINTRIKSIIPNLNLDTYIEGMLKESHREGIVAEDVTKTEWTSGYINKNGEFFGCAEINHAYFSLEICDVLKVDGREEEKFDAQIYLDKQGWVKVSVSRFFWDENIELTQAQKDTIYDYITAKKIGKTAYNTFHSSRDRTYEEAFKEEKR